MAQRVGIQFVAFIGLMGLLSVSSLMLAAASGHKTLRGIYAVSKISSSFQAGTLDNPFVDGLMIRTFWKDAEPKEDQYDWTYMDRQVQIAADHHKKAVLTVVPGAWMPDWARAGVQQGEFHVKYGHDRGEPMQFPMPWDETYLNRWFKFVRALGARYDSNATVVMVPATGPTGATAEMSLPDTEEDIQQWIKLGYTPEKYKKAWDKTVAVFSESFPNTLIGLTLYPSLPIPTQREKELTREAVTESAAKRLDGRMALQTSGLSGRKAERTRHKGGYGLVQSYSGKITTGFQCGTSASERPERMGDSDPVKALRITMDYGFDAGADYLEIYENDIVDPAQQPNLKYARERLSGK